MWTVKTFKSNFVGVRGNTRDCPVLLPNLWLAV
jgi:hypothetical protein